MKRVLLPILVAALAAGSACSAGDDGLAADCAKISASIHVPATADLAAGFAAKLRALQSELIRTAFAGRVRDLRAG